MYRIVLPFYVLVFYVVFIAVRILTLLGLPRRNKSIGTKRVLFLECMGPPSGGFRHRSNGWAERLSHQGVQTDVWFVMDYKKQLQLKQTRIGILQLHVIYLFVRFIQCFRSAKYDVVIVRREILLYNDYGNLFFEKWMRCIHNKFYLDVDDDISAAKHEPRDRSLFGKLMLEHPEKFRASLKYYDKVITASSYLQQRVNEWSDRRQSETLVLPTCVEPNDMPRKNYKIDNEKIVIGWVGSSNNFEDLYIAYPALERLHNEQRAHVLVISDAKPKENLFPITFIPWSLEYEFDNFLKIDIGIMPVQDNAEGRGKGGLKLIQYMGCGIVSVASSVTVNNDIIDDGVNGFLVRSKSDWYNVLINVIAQRENFNTIGEAAAAVVKQRFSYDVHLQELTRFIGVQKMYAHSTSNSATAGQPVK